MTSPLPASSSVDLLWLPLGSGPGSGLVRLSGRAFEALSAARAHRTRRALFHSALVVVVDGARTVVEMTPAWTPDRPGREVVALGPVGRVGWGRTRWFRYGLHRWPAGVIIDAAQAVGGPQRVGEDRDRALRLLDLVPSCPTLTWGRDELGVGDLWSCNSSTSWLLAASGHAVEGLHPPDHGRAPGWRAGLAAAQLLSSR